MLGARLSTIGARVAYRFASPRLPLSVAQQYCRIQSTQTRSISTSLTANKFKPLPCLMNLQIPTKSLDVSSMCRVNPITTPIRFFHPKKRTNKKKIRVGYRFRPHHASLNRYRPLASGLILRFKSGMNHKRRRKSKRQLRALSKKVTIPKTHYRRVRLMLGLKRLPKPLPRRKYNHPVH